MKHIIALLLILIVIPISAQENRFTDSTGIPDNQVGQYVMPFLDMINNADNDQIKEFVQKNYEPSFRAKFSMDEITGLINYIHNTCGKLSFYSVREFQEKLPDNQIMIIVQPERIESRIAFILRTTNDPPYLINNIAILQSNPQIRPALLVIDVQNEYLPRMSEEDKQDSLRMINECIWLFRQKGLPIIRVYNTDPQRGPAVDSEGFMFPSTINISEEDPKIIKNFPSAFRNTNLDDILKEKGCNRVFLCGLSATGCVLATYFGAAERGYNTFMVKDTLMSPNHTQTRVIEDISNTVNIQMLMFMVDQIVKPVEKISNQKELSVSPDILKQYVGSYQLAPNFIMMVTLEGDQLITQATGQPKFPVYAKSETTFVPEAFPAQIEFFKNDKGEVTYLVLTQNGQKVKAPRI